MSFYYHLSLSLLQMIIEEVMGLVELTNLRNAMVGVPGQDGLSAEQRKRLTIAVELISSPSIIFMDEPTSGLDARAAAIVMRAIRKTVDTGRTVVCTIHQPSIEIFEAFDEVRSVSKCLFFFYFGFTSILEGMKWFWFKSEDCNTGIPYNGSNVQISAVNHFSINPELMILPLHS
jgi:ABC-type multidrug transport system ATPase subunit